MGNAPAQQSTAPADEAIEGKVIDPELVFKTPDRSGEVESVEARTFEFEIDGETYKAIRPHKYEEVLRRLIAANSRRASAEDRLWAGEEFLNRVLHPDSIRRINERLNDDEDSLRESDILEYLEVVLRKMGESKREAGGGKAPARARARGRR